MDANGVRFWMFPAQMVPPEKARSGRWLQGANIHRNTKCGTLALASAQPDRVWPVSEEESRERRALVSQTADGFGTRAYYVPQRRVVAATGALPGEVILFSIPDGLELVDMTVGPGGLLYSVIGDRLQIRDLAAAEEAFSLPLAGFAVRRVAPDFQSGIWLLGTDGRLARVKKTDRRAVPRTPVDPNVMRPCAEGRTTPRLEVWAEAPWAGDAEDAVCLLTHPVAGLALLSWDAGGQAWLRRMVKGNWGNAVLLNGVRFPYSAAWVSAERVALLVPGVKDAAVFNVDEQAEQLLPIGEIYPLRDHDGGPFAQVLAEVAHYVSREAVVALRKLASPTFARSGAVRSSVAIDSETPLAVWHRVYLEADLPPKTNVRILVAATDTPEDPPPQAQWHAHDFGEPREPGTPVGAWVPFPSEIPHDRGLLDRAPNKNRTGLFTVLLQRTGTHVRTISGRYLHVRMELNGNGLATPEVAAVRIYGPRFSYRDRYLPQLYHETLFGTEADAAGASTGPDFLERYLDNFEGMLTLLEDRIGSADRLMHPDTAPPQAIEWLGGWIGLAFDPSFPTGQRRQMLQAAPRLFRRHGTLAGLTGTLDIATNGFVRQGKVVAVEDFRLRRVLATILGANLEDLEDPLTLGLMRSGNSFVGDTLVLGDESQREFLAMFAGGLDRKESEDRAVDAIFEKLAYRVTVLVRSDVVPDTLALIRRIAERETPAHVLTRVLIASAPLMADLSSLTGVDTYLDRAPQRQPVRVGESYLGVRDFLIAPASLDPRLEAGQPPSQLGEFPGGRPIADAGQNQILRTGDRTILDASESRAAPGRRIDEFEWTQIENP